MPRLDTQNQCLLEALLEARAMASGPSVSELFTHIHHERMVSVFEDAPEFAGIVPELPKC